MAKRSVRRKQNIPKDESKGDRFVRVVTPRVGKAIKAINQISLCAGTTYESTPKQQQDIYKALDRAFQSMRAAFEKKTEPTAGFKFET
ncbi:hypothetical protein ES703_81665 [subsurface metagenome]